MIYAHSRQGLPEEEWQTLDEHHTEVAARAERFARPWAPLTAALLGKTHDTGKTSDSFQKRIRGKGGKVDHTSAAWLCLMRQWARPDDPSGEILARLLVSAGASRPPRDAWIDAAGMWARSCSHKFMTRYFFLMRQTEARHTCMKDVLTRQISNARLSSCHHLQHLWR